MGRVLITCIAVSLLAACNSTIAGQTTPGLSAWLGADVVSVVATQKTIEDHVISGIIGEDCSTVRASNGGKYCEEIPKPAPTMVRTAYCYRTLAAVSCYNQPFERDAGQFYGERVENIPITMP